MEKSQLSDRKHRRLLKMNVDDDTFGNLLKTATASSKLIDSSKVWLKHGDNLDTNKHGRVDYSIERSERSNFVNGRRSHSLENMWNNDTKWNKLQPKPKTLSSSVAGTNCCSKHWLSDLVDIILRIIAVLVFIKLETTTAFHRKIHMEELWLYQNPRMPDIVTPTELLLSVIFIPWITSILFYRFRNDVHDYRAANWAWTLGLCVNGLITSTLKVTLGRPRPDFFYRCFPDGVMILNNSTDSSGLTDIFNCTGNLRDINEGRKSFPSGHSSFAFTSFGFVTFYVGTKLHVFDARGWGQTWRFVIALTPLAIASLIAISRTCDYHHHWQDVSVGAVIGLISSYFTYRQYYPSIFDDNSEVPLPRFKRSQCVKNRFSHTHYSESVLKKMDTVPSNDETLPLLHDQ